MEPLLIFDLDGTIHETLRIYELAVRHCMTLMRADGYDIREVSSEEIASCLGMNYKEMWSRFMPDISDEARDKYAAIIGQQMIENVVNGKGKLYDGILDQLDKLYYDGFGMVILSNCKKAYMDQMVATFGLNKYFRDFFDCESYDYASKEEIYEHIVSAYPDCEKYILIGDKKSDISFGNHVTTRSIGCAYGYGTSKDTEGANIVINDVSDLYAAVLRLSDELRAAICLSACNLCGRKCGRSRYGEAGMCGIDDKIYLSRAALHFYEEPCISGENGSGAIFFAGCNLKCVYCQNKEISRDRRGLEVSVDRLVEIFFELKEKGASNINLVTPTMYAAQIYVAIKEAKRRGFDLPFIYNCGGYESISALEMLDGLIDCYLPDFKYMDDELAVRYSKAPNYVMRVKAVIDEMYRQTGPVCFDQNGMITRGVIVRHLCLPGHKEDSKAIIKYLYETFGDNIFISIMSQYTPLDKEELKAYGKLAEKLDFDDYEEILDYAIELGVDNAFVQEDDVADESFIPDFDFEGVEKA